MCRAVLLLLLCMMIPGCGGVDWFPAIGPDSPFAMTLTASSDSPMVNASVTITATVKKKDGTAVPDGTIVSFSISSGTGTLSAFSVATQGGDAGVTLTSASAGEVRVMASTGIISNSTSVTFQPTITITASTTSVSIFNVFTTPVTITATVKNSDGSSASDGTPVIFAAPGASSISPGTANTVGGVATTEVTLPNFITTISVTATAGSVTSAPVLISIY